jgi:TRAP-type C4-dicarboxylate transport system permease large subunit
VGGLEEGHRVNCKNHGHDVPDRGRSTAFSQVLAYSQASEELVMFLTGLGAAPIVSLIMMLVVVLILGFFMDSFSIIMITVPIFMP